MIVLDASAVLEVLLQTSVGAPIGERLLTVGTPLHAPHLLDVEVTHTLRRFVARGEVTEARAALALKALADFPVERYPHGILLTRIWTLRQNLTAYDAAYVALAEALDATLLTRDARIRRAPGHFARVEVF